MSYKEHIVMVYSDGKEEWYFNGQQHRENGPAVIYPNGIKYWYCDGKLHREDGPAVEYPNDCDYWLNGKHYSKEDWESKLNKGTCKDKIVEIDGKQFQLKEI